MARGAWLCHDAAASHRELTIIFGLLGLTMVAVALLIWRVTSGWVASQVQTNF